MNGLKISPRSIPGVLLDVSFDQNGDLVRESFLVKVENGKQVVTETLPPLSRKYGRPPAGRHPAAPTAARPGAGAHFPIGGRMADFIQLILSGLATGAIYALAALGFTLLWQASQTINFAQGEFVMLPAFIVLVGITCSACRCGSRCSSRCVAVAARARARLQAARRRSADAARRASRS